MKKYIKLIIVLVSAFIVYSFTNLGGEQISYGDTFYDDRLANAIVYPTIKTVEDSNTDMVKLTLTKGTYDFSQIVFRDVNEIANSIVVNLDNNNTTQYISAKNGRYQVIIRDSSGAYTTFSTIVTIDNSCENEYVTNAKGVVEFQRCFKYSGVANQAESDTANDIAPTCADGYVLKSTDYNQTITYNECASLSKSDLTQFNVDYRYCTMKFKYECVASTTSNSSNLASLSVNGMTPSFKATTYTYSVNTSSSSVSIGASLNSDGSSFVSGYGPRTVSVGYGTSSHQIKVKSSSGNITTYTVKITRADSRDTTNTLDLLNIGSTPFNQTFNPNTNFYSVSVDDSVEELYVNAELTADSSSFLEGFGPRRVTLKDGVNAVYVKVKSESGSVRIYTIEVRKGDTSINTENNVFLEDLKIDMDDDTIVLKPEFQKEIYQYNVTIPYDVTLLLIKPTPEDKDDEVIIEGNEDYQVGDNVVTITVTDDKGQEKVYTLHVNRMEKNLDIDTDSSLKELSIEGFDIRFKEDTTNYNIKIKEGQKELSITATPNSDRASIEIIDNVDLKVDSEVIVRVNAEDGTFTDYVLFVEDIDNGTNLFLVIIIVLLIVIALVYLVLRMLGYKIVINTDTFKSMFGGNKKKKKSKK